MDDRTRLVRAAGKAGVVAGVLTGVGGLAVQVARPRSTVAADMWSYPWPGAAFVAVTLLYAALHVLAFASFWGFSVSALAGPGRAARTGHILALTGTAVLVLAEVVSLFWIGRRNDETGPSATAAVFGLGTLLTAVGFLVLGVRTVRAGLWYGWQRVTPLALGIWTTVLMVLIVTPISALAIGVYGLCIAALGLALVTAPIAPPQPTSVVGPAAVS